MAIEQGHVPYESKTELRVARLGAQDRVLRLGGELDDLDVALVALRERLEAVIPCVPMPSDTPGLGGPDPSDSDLVQRLTVLTQRVVRATCELNDLRCAIDL